MKPEHCGAKQFMWDRRKVRVVFPEHGLSLEEILRRYWALRGEDGRGAGA